MNSHWSDGMSVKDKGAYIEWVNALVSTMSSKSGAVITVASYLVFHDIATIPVGTLTAVDGQVTLLGRSYVAVGAYMQFIVPMVFVLAICFSAYQFWRRSRIFQKTLGISTLSAMPWSDFEFLLLTLFSRQRYMVEVRPGVALHKNIDMIIYKEGRKVLVQGQRHSPIVDLPQLLNFYRSMLAEEADEGIFVTIGVYAEEAIDFAGTKPISLIDGEKLLELIKRTAGAKVSRAAAVISFRK